MLDNLSLSFSRLFYRVKKIPSRAATRRGKGGFFPLGNLGRGTTILILTQPQTPLPFIKLKIPYPKPLKYSNNYNYIFLRILRLGNIFTWGRIKRKQFYPPKNSATGAEYLIITKARLVLASAPCAPNNSFFNQWRKYTILNHNKGIFRWGAFLEEGIFRGGAYAPWLDTPL